MASSEIRDLLLLLRRIERSWYPDPHIKDIIKRLKLKLNILILKCDRERDLGFLLKSKDGDGDGRLSQASGKLKKDPDLDELTLIKPEMEEIYFAFLKPPKHVTSKSDKYVVSFINLLLENLKDVLRTEVSFFAPLKPEISALEEKMRFLRSFLVFISEIDSSQGFSKGLLFSFVQAVAFNIAYLLHFLQLDKSMEEELVSKLKIELLGIVDKINPLHLDAGRISGQALKAYKAKVVIDAGCFMYSPIFNKSEVLALTLSKEQISQLMIEPFDESRGFVKLINEYRGFFPISSMFKFPTTNGLGFVDFILYKLKERLLRDSSDYLLKSHINTVYEGLEALRHNFGGNSGLINNGEGSRALSRYMDLVYQAEYFVDLHPSKVLNQIMELAYLAKQIRHIQKEIETIINDTQVHNNISCSSWISSEDYPQRTEEVVNHEVELGCKIDKTVDQLVGLEDETNLLLDQLTRGSKELKILSIVGMPGVGKTTLASSVYNDPLVTKFFHLRAWCSVSQVYKSHTLLSDILRQITELTNQTCGTSAISFAEKVYKGLKGNRYLIVIDDIWTIEAWDVLKESFPNDYNGSRVIFTTRHHAVASQAKSVPHDIRLLSDEESWKLLQVKLFKEETCPSELLEVGKRIAENCKGLPLSIVLTAGLLKMTERKRSCWKQVEQRLRSHDPSEQHLHALELSYRHLPDYLKSCFLYFGAFPEDTEIPVRKLLQLWVAEGFVYPPKIGPKSAEDEAGNYLNDLVDRSLVMIAKRSSDGRAKGCCIHDVIHDFCLARAKQESFMLAIDKCDTSSRFQDSEVHQQYRLCIGCNSIPPVAMGYFESRVRTLQITKSRGIYQGQETMPLHTSCFPEEFSGLDVIKFKFRLLRVLDLGTIKVKTKSDFIVICNMLSLRFLSLVYTREIPKEISNLKSLETFLLNGPTGVVLLPRTLWDMTNLRHLHFGKVAKSATAVFELQHSRVTGKCCSLNHLTSVSPLFLPLNMNGEKILRNLPCLRKLGCTFATSLNDSVNYRRFLLLDFLNHLESLKISLSGKVQYPFEFNFPSNLRRLTVSEFQLPWDAMSVIGRLCNLEVLKLLNKAFTGQEWNMREGDFLKLKFLKLDQLDIAVWNGSSEHLPVLEQLVLHQCKHLEQVPSDFGEIHALKMINVTWCNPSVDHSIRRIQEEQLEMGNDQLNVYIYPPIGNDCSFIAGKGLHPPKGSGRMNGRLQRRTKTPAK
ncbi:hypothetical protein M9H77_08094 [Catharanthus roseus]|uniref:Uncharacterized protein n=1 Tax=Catharanthus roseus TaxID=4058 RepID=A0ACC0BX32_CATRO|nr:hypothetical protein M9H77_08094 [Catharanthus roseus]